MDLDQLWPFSLAAEVGLSALTLARQRRVTRSNDADPLVKRMEWWNGGMRFASQGSLCLCGGNSNMFDFHPYLGKISNLTNIFSDGLKPPTSCVYFPIVSLLKHQSARPPSWDVEPTPRIWKRCRVTCSVHNLGALGVGNPKTNP